MKLGMMGNMMGMMDQYMTKAMQISHQQTLLENQSRMAQSAAARQVQLLDMQASQLAADRDIELLLGTDSPVHIQRAVRMAQGELIANRAGIGSQTMSGSALGSVTTQAGNVAAEQLNTSMEALLRARKLQQQINLFNAKRNMAIQEAEEQRYTNELRSSLLTETLW